MYGGMSKNLNVFIKTCIYSYIVKISDTFKVLIGFNTPIKMLFFYSKQFWTRQFWCLLLLLLFFVSPLPHFPLREVPNFSLWGLFSSRETNKKVLGDQVNREGGAWGLEGHAAFVKNYETLNALWAGVLINHLLWNGQTHRKSLSKKFTDAECSLSQHHQLVHWHRWVPRTLT